MQIARGIGHMIARSSILVLLVSAAIAQAGDEERRTYSVAVDKKPAGSHQIVIQTRDDGTQVVNCQADVTVRVFLITFRYSFRSTETYKNGQLVQMSSNTNDDGKKHSVSIEANDQGLAMKADGKDILLKGNYWTTTYWKLPPEKQRGPNIAILDADTGKVTNAKFDKVGAEKLTIAGQAIDCTHYRLSGNVKADLWFDGNERMVRQDSVEDGHRTVLELTGSQRN
jgi:hypothetical protein